MAPDLPRYAVSMKWARAPSSQGQPGLPFVRRPVVGEHAGAPHVAATVARLRRLQSRWTVRPANRLAVAWWCDDVLANGNSAPPEDRELAALLRPESDPLGIELVPELEELTDFYLCVDPMAGGVWFSLIALSSTGERRAVTPAVVAELGDRLKIHENERNVLNAWYTAVTSLPVNNAIKATAFAVRPILYPPQPVVAPEAVAPPVAAPIAFDIPRRPPNRVPSSVPPSPPPLQQAPPPPPPPPPPPSPPPPPAPRANDAKEGPEVLAQPRFRISLGVNPNICLMNTNQIPLARSGDGKVVPLSAQWLAENRGRWEIAPGATMSVNGWFNRYSRVAVAGTALYALIQAFRGSAPATADSDSDSDMDYESDAEVSIAAWMGASVVRTSGESFELQLLYTKFVSTGPVEADRRIPTLAAFADEVRKCGFEVVARAPHNTLYVRNARLRVQ